MGLSKGFSARGHTAALLLGLSLGLAATAPARAEKVGVAAAVNPDAFSSLSQTPNQQLNIGKQIFYNERINTSGSGLVQVLLVDGSTFTVGPNSDLVIDKFVYDPRKKTGEMVATFSKGTMRFIGGKLSKNEGGVKVKTPAGALAIRGGMFDARVNGRKGIFAFRYGVSLTYTGNGVRREVFEKGYVLDLTGNSVIVRPGTPEDTQLFQSAFSGGGTAIVPGQDNQQTNQLALTDTISLQDLIADATAEQINNSLQQEETQTQTQNNNTPSNNNNNNNDPPAPTQVTVRVLNLPGTYTAFPGTSDEFTTHNGDSILGGDDLAEVDDFIHTFSIVNGRLVGTVSGLRDSFPGEEGPETGIISDAAVNFPAVFPGTQCDQLGVCIVTDATITQDGRVDNYVGRFVGRQGFFAYHVTEGEIDLQTQEFNLDPNPEVTLAFGGTPYNFEAPSGKVYLFALTPDALANSPAPFSSAESMPEQGFGLDATSTSPLLLLTKDSNPDSNTVWLQTSLYIGSTSGEEGYDQQSFVNVALGGISDDGGLIGARRGGSHVDIYRHGEGYIRESLAFTGDIASLAGPDNTSHFLGTDDPNIVIGLDSTGTHNIGNDIPLDPDDANIENDSGASYHVGIGFDSFQPATQQGGTFQGYAVGMVESEEPTSGFTNVVASQSPDDVSLSFDPVTNTLRANLTVFSDVLQPGDNATDAYTFGFGDDATDPQNRSAYIDDQHYAAIESVSGTTVYQQYNQFNLNENANIAAFHNSVGNQVPYQNVSATSYFVSGEQLNVTAYFPETFGQPGSNGIGQAFCENCTFLKWGGWGTRVGFDNGESEGSHYVDNVHLGWWAAGPLSATAELDSLADIQNGMPMTANYAGNVLADVRNNAQSYVAAGKLGMFWNFNAREGNLTISQFDGSRTFTATQLKQLNTNINQFSGTLSGGELTGAARGSFANNNGVTAGGVLGNWNVGGQGYKATGIFAGSGTPIRTPVP